jgi:predicted  nucleic acid-binding Zn-ribbon protein
MDWNQILTVLAVVLANLGTIIALYMHLDNKTESTLKGMQASIEAINADSKQFQQALLHEIRDFHGRLCAIEERNRGK